MTRTNKRPAAWRSDLEKAVEAARSAIERGYQDDTLGEEQRLELAAFAEYGADILAAVVPGRVPTGWVVRDADGRAVGVARNPAAAGATEAKHAAMLLFAGAGVRVGEPEPIYGDAALAAAEADVPAGRLERYEHQARPSEHVVRGRWTPAAEAPKLPLADRYLPHGAAADAHGGQYLPCPERGADGERCGGDLMAPHTVPPNPVAKTRAEEHAEHEAAEHAKREIEAGRPDPRLAVIRLPHPRFGRVCRKCGSQFHEHRPADLLVGR